VVRNPAKVQDLADRGITVREGDYSRPDTLAPALEGVEKILLISSTEVSGRLPQHRAVIDAAEQAGVPFLAYTSMLHADTSPARLAVEHRQTEEIIRLPEFPPSSCATAGTLKTISSRFQQRLSTAPSSVPQKAAASRLCCGRSGGVDERWSCWTHV
jgi:hypothetical protein